ncbi:MAG: tRNA uridine-5-carboxymethylaminomethyl(34) synthesis GTPase MnmE [Oscillospiraceae bacterium]|nr:tRNA uridine-5-carboxymethylaminomethyl(34) synthesis GTPase MnmE [Oscillospiraceae bacterium]
MSDTIAAVATGAVLSAIGIVRLSGDGAIALADTLFRPQSGRPMRESEPRRLVYGSLYSRAGELLDLCLCTISRAPDSYTGEDTAEFQCHGSPVVLRTLLDELFALGARQALPGEFTKRAFLNGKLDLTSAEAVADLIEAESAESAKNAAGQLAGALGARTEGVYAALADISAHYHAVLDYPDEDIEPFRLQAYERTLEDAAEELHALLATYGRGKLMQSGIPAAIVGRPNAGKSSLLNALLGYERAIVTRVPGTTRDTIEEKLRLGRICLRLIDTAGLRETDDEVERLGVERSRSAMERAELLIAVIDGSEALTEEDAAILAAAEKAKKAIVVLSKKDLSDSAELQTTLPVVKLSSVTGEGIEALGAAIEAMFPLPEVPAGGILTNARHAEAVSRALGSVEAALQAMREGATPDIVLTESEAAMAALGELDGRTVREDVTARIFSRFCVGK